MFWQILPSILLYVWFLEGFDLLKIYIPYVYICIYLYIPHNEFITSWTSMFNETVSKDTEILLPSLGLIKYIHGMIHLLYCRHWTDKRKYIPYISVTHKVVKSCGSNMTTCYMMYIMYDVHKASSLYKRTCRQSFFMYNFFFVFFISFFFFSSFWSNLSNIFPTLRDHNGNKKSLYGKSPHQPKTCLFSSPPWKNSIPPNFYSLIPSPNLQITTQQKYHFVCSPCYCTFFGTQGMLILILFDVQYSQSTVFRFEKGSNCQNHSFSAPHHPLKRSPQLCHYFLT